MKANFTSEPVFLELLGKDLGALIRKLIVEVSSYIDNKYNCSHIVSYNQIVTTNNSGTKICYFKKFFILSPWANDIFYDEAWVVQAFKFSNCVAGYDDVSGMQILLAGGRQNYSRAGATHLRKGLWLLLVLLFRDGVILLPANFRALREKVRDNLYTDFGFELYPELVSFFISARHKIYCDDFWSGSDIKVRERVAQYGTKLCWITGSRVPEELDLNLVIKVYEEFYYERNGLAAEIPIKTLVPFVLKKYWARVSYTTEQLFSGIDCLAAARRDLSRKGLQGHIKESMDETEILDGCCQINRSRFFPVVLSEKGHPEYAVKKIDVWVDFQLIYISHKSYESLKAAQYGFGILNIYLSVYLPLWFDKFDVGCKYKFPDEPSLFDVTFSAPLYRNPDAPMPFVIFASRILKGRESAIYNAVSQIHRFFDWLEAKASTVSSLKGFKNTITSLDIPKVDRILQTEKGSFTPLEYTAALNYLPCLLEALKLLNQAIISYGAEIKNWPDLYKAALHLGWNPKFKFRGYSLQISELPSKLFPKWRVRLKGRGHVTIFAPHRIVHLLVSFDSGIRHQSVQWLGCDFAEYLPKEDIKPDSCYFLKVAVDKVKKDAFDSCVFGKTIFALSYQLAIRGEVDSSAFDSYQYYEGNEDSRFVQLLPLFSYDCLSGKPYGDNYYAVGYYDFLFGFQRFLKKNSIECHLYELKPLGFSFGEPIDVSRVVTSNNAEASYCPIVSVSYLSPHSTRVTLVTSYSGILSDEEIGRMKTGQSPKLVRYYDKSTSKRTTSDLSNINSAINSIWSGEAIHAHHKDSAFRQALSISPESSMDDFKCLSTPLASDSEARSGVDQIKLRTHSGLAHHATHVCTRNNNCHADFRCGVCLYGVSGLDHLEAIDFKIYAFHEEIRELHFYADTLDVELCGSELEVVDQRLRSAAVELVGWEWRRANLIASLNDVDRTKKDYVTMRPEILDKELKSIELDSDSREYIMARLYQAAEFPGLQNDVIRVGLRSFVNSILGGNLSVLREYGLQGDISISGFVGVVKNLMSEKCIDLGELMKMLTDKSKSDYLKIKKS